MHLLCTVAMGIPLPDIIEDGGDHGATTIGTHGIGVSTPNAAAVAAATCGFAILWHIPNGGIFDAVISVIVADGMEPNTNGKLGCPCAANTDGAMPNEQLSIVPVHKSFGMVNLASVICLGT